MYNMDKYGDKLIRMDNYYSVKLLRDACSTSMLTLIQ